MAEVDWQLVAEVTRVQKLGPAHSLPRHRHDLSREDVALNQRARVLTATAFEVAERGYDRTTVASIGAKAGVSSKTFYGHFKDKEDAFLGLYVMLDASVAQLTELLSTGPRDPKALLELGITFYLNSLEAAPQIAQVLVVDALGSTRRIALRRIQALEDFAAAVEVGVERVSGQPVPEDRREFVVAMIGATGELVYQRMLRGDDRPLSELLPVLLEIGSSMKPLVSI